MKIKCVKSSCLSVHDVKSSLSLAMKKGAISIGSLPHTKIIFLVHTEIAVLEIPPSELRRNFSAAFQRSMNTNNIEINIKSGASESYSYFNTNKELTPMGKNPQ